MLVDVCGLETCCSMNKIGDIMVIFRRYHIAFLDDLDFADNAHVVLIILYRTADSGKNNKNGGRSQTNEADDQDKNDEGNKFMQKKRR